VNEVNPSFIAQSFHQLLDQILPFASSSIDVLFPRPGTVKAGSDDPSDDAPGNKIRRGALQSDIYCGQLAVTALERYRVS
jgi:hypothetical protein